MKSRKLTTGRFETREELEEFIHDQYFRIRTRTITQIAMDAKVSPATASKIIDKKFGRNNAYHK